MKTYKELTEQDKKDIIDLFFTYGYNEREIGRKVGANAWSFKLIIKNELFRRKEAAKKARHEEHIVLMNNIPLPSYGSWEEFRASKIMTVGDVIQGITQLTCLATIFYLN